MAPKNGYSQAQPAVAPVNSHVLDLQKKAAALRAQLKEVEAAIDSEEALLRAPQVHRRPSYSLLAGEEQAEVVQSPTVQHVGPQDFNQVLSKYPKLEIAPIGSYNHWDRRECAVQNVADWKAACEKYQREVLKGSADIPKVIHQIWIGPREPPCLWIDTFRVEYLAAHPEWGFHLWSDEEVSKLPMINEEIYKEEKMWQCKADILRLEFLWHHGGMYVDADMISVDQKQLDVIFEYGKESGWVIAYEPDTKDKPYSILGNSVIACTPHHPLTLMLILYLKQTYHHKRHVIEVFAVTGPVMYTKCLVDSGMPISIAPQDLLYPAFHYVPNPDAINYSAFPKCLMFQFGYTCSGLEGYVKSKNRCKKARQCPFHSKKEWPLGPFKALPAPGELEANFASKRAAIPKVIHQIVFAGVDGLSDPVRWRQTWWDGFKQSHPDFEYKVWTKEMLQGKSWFCSNLYLEPLDDHAVTALMMEVLLEEGGFYVPLSSLHATGHSQDSFFLEAIAADSPDFVEGNGGVLGSAKGSPECYRQLMELYDKGTVPAMPPPTPAGPRIHQMGFRDGAIGRARYSQQTKFLGAAKVVACSGGAGDQSLEQSCLSLAYECQVPCLAARGTAALMGAVETVAAKAIFITDREFFQMESLKQELAGQVDSLGHSGWDAALFGIEWGTGSEEVVTFPLAPGGRPRNCKVVGFIANFPGSQNVNALRKALQACVTEDSFDPSVLFDSAGQLALHFVAEKYAGTIEEARIFRNMPLVHRVFSQLANHDPPMHFDQHELHGNLMKATNHGSLRFEMILEPNGGIMFRCWNDDNSTNCEMKMNSAVVEWMKIYHDHQVAREIKNQPIP